MLNIISYHGNANQNYEIQLHTSYQLSYCLNHQIGLNKGLYNHILGVIFFSEAIFYFENLLPLEILEMGNHFIPNPEFPKPLSIFLKIC